MLEMKTRGNENERDKDQAMKKEEEEGRADYKEKGRSGSMGMLELS